MSKIIFKTSKTVPGDGMRVTRVTNGVVEMLVQTNPPKWSELVGADAPIVTPPPPPIEPPPTPIEPPVVVPPVTPPVAGITSATFAAALLAAKPGDELVLAAGEYAISQRPKFSGAVTIRSAIPFAAKFAAMDLNGAMGLIFEDIAFDYKFKPGDSLDVTPFSLESCSDITFMGCLFDGDIGAGLDAVSNGYAVGRGLYVNNSQFIQISECEVRVWLRGLLITGSTDVTVAGNNIHSIRSDGMDCVTVTRITIEENWIHDFKGAPGSADHSDFIQFWTSGQTKPSTDVVIRNNILDVGQGSWTETIFMRNEAVDQGKASFAAMAYRNIRIENNTIRNAHTHGITVGEADGLMLRNNTIIAKPLNTALPINAAYIAQFGGPAAAILIPKILMSQPSVNVTITGNAFAGRNDFNGPWVNAGDANGNGVPLPAAWAVANNPHLSAESLIPIGVGAPA